jgi:hypothetical protein
VKLVSLVATIGVTLGAVSCASNHDTAAALTRTVTSTVTTTLRISDEQARSRTVRQTIAEDGTNRWLARLDKAGLGDWPYKTVNDWAWQICHELWVGGDYNKIIDQLALGSTKRGDILALYGAAVGFTCNQPPGAPPGMPN